MSSSDEKIMELLLSINERLTKLEKKFDTHVDFIEETYSTLRSPLNYIKNKVNRLMGYSDDSNLPQINYNENNNKNNNNDE